MILHRFRLDGRKALVTGAARGIGFATAQAPCEAGAEVIVTDLNADGLKQATDDLRSKGLTETGGAGRHRSGRSQSALRRHRSAPGHARRPRQQRWHRDFQPSRRVDERRGLGKVIDVNLNSVFYCCRAFGAGMLAKGRGAIVNNGSMSGVIVNRPQEQAIYNATKPAVHLLTRSSAAEWGAHGVRVNAVAPTCIEMEMNSYIYQDQEMHHYWIGGTPMGRMGRADEVAAVTLFLASDAASLRTGSIVLADGGYACW